jgi:hypothetical protein
VKIQFHASNLENQSQIHITAECYPTICRRPQNKRNEKNQTSSKYENASRPRNPPEQQQVGNISRSQKYVFNLIISMQQIGMPNLIFKDLSEYLPMSD